MPMPPLNPDSIEIHTAVKRSQRDYLMQLAAMPGLTKITIDLTWSIPRWR